MFSVVAKGCKQHFPKQVQHRYQLLFYLRLQDGGINISLALHKEKPMPGIQVVQNLRQNDIKSIRT